MTKNSTLPPVQTPAPWDVHYLLSGQSWVPEILTPISITYSLISVLPSSFNNSNVLESGKPKLVSSENAGYIENAAMLWSDISGLKLVNVPTHDVTFGKNAGDFADSTLHIAYGKLPSEIGGEGFFPNYGLTLNELAPEKRIPC